LRTMQLPRVGAALVVAWASLVRPLAAQDSLRVLRRTPGDSAAPSSIISITFDRPIAGALDTTPGPDRIFHISPAIPGSLVWRDPITLRFIPSRGLASGTRYSVTVDSGVHAEDGTSLAAPYHFTFRVVAAKLLARSFDHYTVGGDTLAPSGRIGLLYSAPVDAQRLRTLRIELSNCAKPDTIALRVRAQRPIGEDDPDNFRYVGGYPSDTMATRLRTVVEIEPVAPLPLDCDANVVVPTMVDDSLFGREERYPVRTAPVFRVYRITCDDWSSFACVSNQLLVWFGAPVLRDEIIRHVRVDGKEAIPSTEEPIARVWRLKVPLSARTTYTVSVAPAIRDAYGRPLDGPPSASIDIDDHVPQIMHAVGTITVPRSGPHTFPLRSVNVRSVRILAYRIPERARVSTIGTAPSLFDRASFIRGIKPETTIVALSTRLNVDTTVDVPLPPLALAPDHPLVAIQLQVKEPIADAHPASATVARKASYLYWPDRGFAWGIPIALAQVTDLAATARLIGTTNGTAFVTDLADGRPRTGVKVTQFDQFGRVVGRGTTNESGIAALDRVLPDSAPPPQTPTTRYQSPRHPVLQAESSNDRLLFSLGARQPYGNRALDAEMLGARFDPSPLFAGALFAERGIFRPGEVVHLKGVVRTGILGALRAPSRGDSARITVRKAAGSWADDSTQYIRDTIMRVSPFGTIVDSVRVREGLPLGNYVADLKVIAGTQWRTIRSTSFRVAEYRAPEFLFDLEHDTATHYTGDTVNLQVQARFLFGAPMRGAVLNWMTEPSAGGASSANIPRSKGWTVGDAAWFYNADTPKDMIRRGVETLDANGHAVLRIPMLSPSLALPGQVQVNVALTDISRQVQTSETSIEFNSSRLFILARAMKGRPWRLKEPATVEFRTVDAHGRLIKNVEVEVVMVRQRSLGGNPVTRTRPHDVTDTTRREVVYATDGTGTVTFTPDELGSYIVVLKAKDSIGAPTLTTVMGRFDPPYVTASVGGYRLSLKPDRPRYKVGDVAHVHFDSPFANAEAWITVEREGILEQRRQRVRRGDNVVDLNLSERYAPSIFISVTLSARTNPAIRADTATDRLRAGYVELHVAPVEKALSVSVSTDRRVYAPGDSVSVRLRIRDAKGRGTRAEVALWGADEGVLALTGFSTPDILAQVYSPKGVGSLLWSSIPTLLTTDPKLSVAFLDEQRRLAMSAARTAGNSAIIINTKDLRSRFAATAFYVGAVETNDRGEAVARVRLPENLTTFRVMAVAVSRGDGYGRGDTSLVITRPLVARAALPRFVRPSDSLLAGVVVTPRDGKPRPATAEISATGLAVHSPAQMSISLSGNSTEARFVVQAPARDKIGDSIIVRLGATDGASADATETKLAVRPDFHPRTHAILGAVRDSQDVAIVLPPDIDPTRSRMRLRIGTSPLSTMLAAYRWLRASPFDCTEQLTSTGRALLAVWLATKGDHPDALGDPHEKLQEIVGEIVQRQNSEGEFLYWRNVQETNPWLTAYVGMFLLDARDAGVFVDAEVLARATNFLRRISALPIDTGGVNRYEQRWNRLALGDRVAAAEYLRRASAPDTAVERKLLRISDRMTWEDRLRLAEFLAPRADTRAEVEALLDAAWRTVTAAGHRVDLPDSSHAPRAFPSRVAPAARLLSASLVLRPAHPLLGALMETVIQHGRAESAFAWSSQDYASVVMALARVADQNGGDRVVRARSSAGVYSVRPPRAGIDTTIAAPIDGMLETDRTGNRILRLHVDATAGERPIYYALEVDEIPLAAPVKPDVRGIVVERWYERPADGVPVSHVIEGDLVRVKLRITVPADREFVAVEDPLPAGLEAIDETLRTSAAADPRAQNASVRRDEREPSDDPFVPRFLYGGWVDGRWSIWEHKETHDDRVSYFARMLWTGTYTASYLARATTAGNFVTPPAYAEEMYNPAVQGRSSGGRFLVDRKP